MRPSNHPFVCKTASRCRPLHKTRLSLFIPAWIGALALSLASCNSAPKRWTYKYRPNRTASLCAGKARPPKGVPKPVAKAIEGGNQIVGLPYKYGGGHRSAEDGGYDCSGSVSYALIAGGLLDRPCDSRGFLNYGSGGEGKHITLYIRKGHVFADIAGLRLDTGYGEPNTSGPQWSMRSRPASGYVMRHPPGL